MASIKWHDTAEKASETSARTFSGNIWAIVTIVLVSAIIGFIFVSRSGKIPVVPAPAPAIAAPVVPTVKVPTQNAPVIPISDIRVIAVSVENWKFTPNVITIRQNENVVLELTGISGVHGLAVPGLGINVQILPGKTVTVTIPSDKTGTFDFFCSISCGSGHVNMTGKIIIEP